MSTNRAFRFSTILTQIRISIATHVDLCRVSSSDLFAPGPSTFFPSQQLVFSIRKNRMFALTIARYGLNFILYFHVILLFLWRTVEYQRYCSISFLYASQSNAVATLCFIIRVTVRETIWWCLFRFTWTRLVLVVVDFEKTITVMAFTRFKILK